MQLRTSQSDVESVLEIVIPDLLGLFGSDQLENHAVERQLLRSLLRKKGHASSEPVLEKGSGTKLEEVEVLIKSFNNGSCNLSLRPEESSAGSHQHREQSRC